MVNTLCTCTFIPAPYTDFSAGSISAKCLCASSGGAIWFRRSAGWGILIQHITRDHEVTVQQVPTRL